MFDNQFLRLLFDYRGTITRRQYWGGLLFLLLLLSFSDLAFKWDQIATLTGFREQSRIQDYSINVYVFLMYIFNAVTTILYFSSTVVAFSLIIITLKRSRTLGYSKVSGLFFGIITYLSYFLLRGYLNYFQFYVADRNGSQSRTDDDGLLFVIPTISVVVGLIVICTIVVIILLSRQDKIDYEEEVDYDGYDSIHSIFGLMKFSLIFTIITVFFKYAIPFMNLDRMMASLLSVAFIISFIFFYLKIFVKRSQDAGISIGYVILFFFFVVAVVAGYFILSNNDFFYGNPLLAYFVNRICFLSICAYLIYTYILIALPTKKYKELKS